jgi:hypothetical protein
MLPGAKAMPTHKPSQKRPATGIGLIPGASPKPKSKSKPKATATAIDDVHTRHQTKQQLAELGALRGVTKIGLTRILHQLNQSGLLPATMGQPSTHTLRAEVRHAVEDIGTNHDTMYGKVVQSMKLPSKRLPIWEYVNPFAFLSYCCLESDRLFDMLAAAISAAPDRTLRIIVYIDGVNPGNPLAPETERLINAVYWSFAELPLWFLRRKDSWFFFSILRVSIGDDVPGGWSYIMKVILLVFFSPTGHSFLKGCIIVNGDRSLEFTAKFCGILSDEKALKECFNIKGQAGMFPCPDCLNCGYKRSAKKDWTSTSIEFITISCTDPSKFRFRTKEIIDSMKTRLSQATTKSELDLLEKRFGINFDVNGLLWDDHLYNNVLSGFKNYLRDGMHTCSSNGVAGDEIALVATSLARNNVPLEALQLYAKKWHVPRGNGKEVPKGAFKTELMCTNTVRNFASEVLVMVWLMHCFLQEKIAPRNILTDTVQCFSLLYDIMTLLRRGSMSSVGVLKRKVQEHAALFVMLFGEDAVKPKFHHLLHLPDNLEWMNQFLTCFVLERKNYDLKRAAREIKANMEHTVVHDYLNHICRSWLCAPESFVSKYLVNPFEVTIQRQAFLCSNSAVFECGHLFSADIVVMKDKTVSCIVDFWQDTHDRSIAVRVHRYSRVSPTVWAKRTVASMVDPDTIIEAVPYYEVGLTQICIPPEPSL